MSLTVKDKMGNPKFLIIKTGSTYAELRKKRMDFEDMIMNTAGMKEVKWVIRPLLNVELDKVPIFKGIVITGSHKSLVTGYNHDKHFKTVLDIIIKNKIPTLGICFGHQLICYVMGGMVSRNPIGPEFGISTINLTINGLSDPLFRGVNKARLEVFSSHVDSVNKAPPDFVQLAWNEHSLFQAVRYDSFLYGVQFHPEFDKETMEFYIMKNWKLLTKDHLSSPLFKDNPNKLLKSLRSLKKPRVILKNFVGIALNA